MGLLGLSSLVVFFSDRIEIPRKPSRPSSYEIVDIGVHVFATGLNDRGQVVGMTRGRSITPRAFVWSLEEGIEYLSPKADVESFANGINDHGKVVGKTETRGGDWAAYVWSGSSTQPRVLESLGPGSMAYSVNEKNQVVGHILSGAGAPVRTAVLYDEAEGGLRELGTLGGTSSDAVAISDAGHVVGWSMTEGNRSTRAFAWFPEKGLSDLGALGGENSYANAVNSNGEVVGQAEAVPGRFHAFFHDGTAMKDLGTLGGTWSVALSVNDTGEVVGQSQIRRGRIEEMWNKGYGLIQTLLDSRTSVADSHAFLWKGDNLVDLNEVVELDEGWEVLSAAVGVNNRGEIIGFGIKNGFTHSFLLIPKERRAERVAGAFRESPGLEPAGL